jgi:uncharacterized protein YdaT
MDYNSYTFKNKVVDRMNEGDPKKKKTAKLKKGKVTELEEVTGTVTTNKGLFKNIKSRIQSKKSGGKSYAVSKRKGGRKVVTFQDGKKVGKHWRAKGLN